jgi:DNA-binding transcriptional MocR family regulator
VRAPRRIAEALVQVRTDLGTSPILQRAVASYIDDGRFDAHLAKVKDHYRRKRDLMLSGLERYCRDVASWGVPEGGFFVWLRLKSGDVRAAIDAAEQEKVSFIPGSYFAVSPAGFPRHLRLTYGEIPEAQIDEGLRRLGRALARIAA